MTTNVKVTQKQIPQATAIQLCTEIRTRYKGKWYTLAGMQCMGCQAASKGALEKMCISATPDYRGCNLVNARYDGLANG